MTKLKKLILRCKSNKYNTKQWIHSKVGFNIITMSDDKSENDQKIEKGESNEMWFLIITMYYTSQPINIYN